MLCEVKTHGNGKSEIYVITVRQELNTENVFEFEDCLKSLLEKGASRIVLDLLEVKYVCSRGIGIITHALAQCRKRGGDVKLARINNFVTKLLEVIKLDTVFVVVASVEEGVDSFAA